MAGEWWRPGREQRGSTATLAGADGSFPNVSFISSTLFLPSLRARCLPLLLAPRPLRCALRPPHPPALSRLEGGDMQPLSPLLSPGPTPAAPTGSFCWLCLLQVLQCFMGHQRLVIYSPSYCFPDVVLKPVFSGHSQMRKACKDHSNK